MRLAAASVLVLPLALLAGCSSAPGTHDAGTGGTGGAGSPSTFPAFVVPDDPACPGHWHVTFAVYVPGPGGEPHLLDLSVPRLQSGRPYYDLGVAANMTVAAHLHQSGSELGDARLGPFQMHHEASGRCTGIAQALRSVDVQVSEGSLAAGGAHRFSGQNGTWSATKDSPLRILVQAQVNGTNGTYEWREANVAQALAYQPRDGESYLVAIGSFTDAQLRSMAESIPAPLSRTSSAPHPTAPPAAWAQA